MKKAVIQSGGKQYIVTEGETFKVELIQDSGKSLKFVPLLVINDEAVEIGKPMLDTISVTAEIIEQDKQADKVTAIRYKAKKRVHKVRGHRQHQSVLKIISIK